MAIFSSVASLGCSSVVNTSTLPFFPFTSTVVSSDEKWPPELAGEWEGGVREGGRDRERGRERGGS